MKQKECRVVDRSPEAAMKKAIERFGEDALILETREVRRKKEHGLGFETMYELIIEGDDTGQAGVRTSVETLNHTGSLSSPVSSKPDGIESLERQIERMGRLDKTMMMLEERLSMLVSGDSTYPLHTALINGGASRDTVRIIGESFINTGRRFSGDGVDAALEHLGQHLKVADVSTWDEISGVHIFYGAGGTGKTSLIIKLAGMLTGSGRKVTIINLFPRHSGEAERLKVVSNTLGVGAIAVYNLMELKNIIDSRTGSDTVLIDTPCAHTVRELATDRFQSLISKMDPITSHFVFDMGVSNIRIRKELELFEALSCDFCILTKLDLQGDSVAFLDLLAERLLSFSLINEMPDLDSGLSIATKSRLLSLIESCVDAARAIERRKTLNNATQISENNNEEDREWTRESRQENIPEMETIGS
ncbi:MAG: hypothetical protein KOO63_03310 [Bacteroidales bacterium]|nr:hypothetical protein [Candidatus Latescibacterota bacterium]